MKKGRSGFTLIELLVVIAIIAVLAAILFPVMVSVRDKGRQASCQSNLKQWGIAVQMYTDTWDGYFLPVDGGYINLGGEGGWFAVYRRIVRPGSLRCPGDQKNERGMPDGDSLSYGMNVFLGRWVTTGYLRVADPPSGFPTSMSKVQLTSRLMVFAEAMTHITPGGVDEATYLCWNYPKYLSQWTGKLNYFQVRNIMFRHNDGFNSCMADGHVLWYKNDDPQTLLYPGAYTPGMTSSRFWVGRAKW